MEARFNGPAIFSGSKFNGTAVFLGSRFGDLAYFSFACFNRSADFGLTYFDGQAYFDRSKFNEIAYFGAYETSYIYLSDLIKSPQLSSIHQKSDPRVVLGKGPALIFFRDNYFGDFDEDESFIRISKQLQTDHERLVSNSSQSEPDIDSNASTIASFYYGAPKIGASLVCTIFNRSAFFRYTRFNGPTHFGYTNFNLRADFSDSNFNGFADFGYTNFNNQADFSYSNFNKTSTFVYSKFKSNPFLNSSFHDDADFSGCNFEDGAFMNINFFRDTSFSDANFNGPLRFEDSTFKGSLDISRAKFSNFYIDYPYIDHIICFYGPTYLALIKNYRDNEQFGFADDIYYKYRFWSQNQKSWTDGSKLIDMLSLISCGYGVRWLYTIYFGIFWMLFFGFVYFVMISFNDKYESGSVQRLVAALWFSAIVLLSVPSELYPHRSGLYKDFASKIRYHLPVLERIIGWGLLVLFINTLSRIMIRY